MIRMTVEQLRHNRRQFLAAGCAVGLATSFVTITMLAGTLLTATFRNAIAAGYRGADAVATRSAVAADAADAAAPARAGLTADRLETVRGLPAVAGADLVTSADVVLGNGKRSDGVPIASLPSTAALRTVRAGSGRLPKAGGEVAISRTLAGNLRLAVGDRAEVRLDGVGPASGSVSNGRDLPLTVVGLLADQKDALDLVPDAVAAPAEVSAWLSQLGVDPADGTLLVAGRPGTDPETVRTAVAGALGAGWTVRTGSAQTDADLLEMTKGVKLLTGLLLGLAAVAVFAAGLVIANTFQVMVAQRTRMLALLRCVGATRRQVRRSVLLEALLLGALSATAGVLLAVGLADAAASLLHAMDLALPVPAGVRPSLLAIVLPLLVGVLVTTAASFGPARTATRVTPVAALRPAGPAVLRSRPTWLRIGFGAVLLLVGGPLLLVGGHVSRSSRSVTGLLFGVAGGALSFVGVLVLAPLLVPPVVGLAGRLAGRLTGAPGRIAAANALRNPRRTATTAAALLIGVTLVATIVTGADATRASLDARLAKGYPADIAAGTVPFGPGGRGDGSMPAVPGAIASAAGRTSGVDRVVGLRGAYTTVTVPGREPSPVVVNGLDPATASDLVRDPAVVKGLRPGSVLLGRAVADQLGLRAGSRVVLGTGGDRVTLTAAVTALDWGGLLVTPADLDRLAPKAPVSVLWLRLDQGADVDAVRSSLEQAVLDATGSSSGVVLAGPAIDKAVYVKVLNIMTRVVVGLLAVAVLIAVIGVANTLSLSVVERTRELGTVRALGMTRRQLRLMLAVEGGLIAGVGALLGIGLGLLYGWAGTAALIGGLARPVYTAPTGTLAALMVAGVAAGLLASVLPARRAARLPATVALAEG
jgi:putative ABC transport system permease protein